MQPPKINSIHTWQEFYSEIKTNKDWYLKLPQLQELIQQLAESQSEILDIGCGSSNLANELNELGYKNVTCIDYLESVINQMQPQVSGSQYILMDAKDLQFPNNIFDVAITKGTLDFMQEDITEVCQIITEIHRTLKLNGACIIVSQILPEIIRKSLNIVQWNHIYESNFEVNNGCICNAQARAEVSVFVAFK
ncbi:Methyltransferase [Spironucleus salmonicida]|uniref:Methyltransferase n=1 Tax=Spironucleus salmonicida TaxID=348837 RepID=V6LUM4_9EUKA|nr:Methyltransferase [Spironucleus salmonicida]|eukprot:EST44509.1 Methyltransferase domain-containing protein [Spironucleus salmonicida]